jgi:predicted RecB family nuclease
MKRQDEFFRFFAGDLMKFQGCRHATLLDLSYAETGSPEPAGDDAEMTLVQEKGHEHEEEFTDQLRANGRTILEIERFFDNPKREHEATMAALHEGPDIITQAALGSGGNWGGYADFLYRVARPSKLGDYSYEVADTKLSRSPKPGQILQLCLYSDLLAEMQGAMPEFAHLELGSGEQFTVRLDDVAAYARAVRQRFELFVEERPEVRPEPVGACALCRWREHCSDEWERSDSLSLIARVTRSQRRKIENADIATMSQLAGREERIPGLAAGVQEKLVAHARLQTARRNGGPPAFQLLELEKGRGFDLLPRPDKGDLFYDIEGDPYFDGGLEYLHGVWFQEGGAWVFKDFWAHDRDDEGRTLHELMDFFASHLRTHPHAHIYHYAPYEITALRRLTKQHRRHEALMDQLQRDHKFADLYAVVSGAIRVSEGGYSIKDLETFYMEKREGEVATAGASVVAYEKWRETGDQGILDEIREYNKIDCISTQLLRDWLVNHVRPGDLAWPDLDEEASEAESTISRAEEEEEAVARRAMALEPLKTMLGEEAGQLVIDLNQFHKREAKPAWWAIFDRLKADSDELVDDLDCLAGLEAQGKAIEGSRGTHTRVYAYPPQETKLASGKSACLKPADEPIEVTIAELDRSEQSVTIKFPGKISDIPERLDLIPGSPVRTKVLEDAISDVSDSLLAGDEGAAALRQFLLQAPPIFSDARTQILDEEGELPQRIARAISALDASTLAIQGPPGTGKTYVSALSICDLIRAGKRVAVSSNSHKAIENLLLAVATRMEAEGIHGSIVQKVSSSDERPPHRRIVHTRKNEGAEIDGASVMGATAWHFARYGDAAYDYLFIDEAGQVSIANLVAMSRCARNIVLVGDPMQLPQVTLGSHPGQSGLSCFEYLLGNHRTVPATRGVFLPVSRRMHQGVCGFISRAVYEGRLENDAGAQAQTLKDNSGRNRFGAQLIPVEHAGNAQTSQEEVAAIAAEIDNLLGGEFSDRDGNRRTISHKDIVVVAPYNAQVNLLASRLPGSVRVGTVDKFQGQEAPVCLVSMTTSSADELPRDIEFLFSLNRLNVAISRAKVLSLVFASPRLLEVPCNTVDQMKLINTLCLLSEWGKTNEKAPR